MARGPALDPVGGGQLVALLGPTNTGKTHVAVQRMLAHRTGMIGLPLRLLAREVYDRVVAAVGVDAVALVTGEEKRVGRSARYWVCTVESMPVDRPVAFLAVDEVQLAGDPWRGHVFTERILHARGVAETWFLGSDTIAPLLVELVPTVDVRRQPRLSRLSWAGSRKLTALPARSAVVAFSVREVYALAERLRARHGGTAVVTGALSPRARNAQVDLYASGDVQHMVATDAIGMGLNLDVHHVALAGVEKFDGREHRALRDDELAQIAGRAGRFRRDGTFGVTDGVDPLPDERIQALEGHAFPPLRRLFWRNSALCFDDPAALLETLRAPAPRPFLRAVHDADDARALARMWEEPEVRARARGPAAVRLLWDLSRIPDFGHQLPEHHAVLLSQLFVRMVDGGGALDPEWLRAQLARVDRMEGDLDTLTTRIAAIRIWTTVVSHPGWVPDAEAWQGHARDVEDRLSDALHARLTARFVDTRASVLVRGLAEGSVPEVTLGPGGRVEAAGRVLGTLHGLRFDLAAAGAPSAALDRAARRVIAPMLAERVEALVGSPDGAFGVDPKGAVRWDGARVARLIPGDSWRQPRLRLLRLDALEGPARAQVGRRLERWMANWLTGLTAPLAQLKPETPAERVIAHALERGLGVAPVVEIGEALAHLDEPARTRLRAGGLWLGRRWVWHRGLLPQVEVRAALAVVFTGRAVDLPGNGGQEPFREGLDPVAARWLGFERLAGWWLRADTLEAVLQGSEAQVAVRREVAEAVRAAARPPRGRGRR